MSRHRRIGLPWIALAGVLGLIHAGFSAYWGLGGTWLLETVGQNMIRALDGAHWLLLLVGLVKAGCAVIPYLLARAGRLFRGPWLWISWLGSAVLILWGGAGCLMAQLVLAGVVEPGGGYDHAGQFGHAWLWDPLFLLWGIALGLGLIRGTQAATGSSEIAQTSGPKTS
jgi:hypothetical protein